MHAHVIFFSVCLFVCVFVSVCVCVFVLHSYSYCTCIFHLKKMGWGCPCVRLVHKHVCLQVSMPCTFIVPGNCWPHPESLCQPPLHNHPVCFWRTLELDHGGRGVMGLEHRFKTNHSDGQQRQGGKGGVGLGGGQKIKVENLGGRSPGSKCVYVGVSICSLSGLRNLFLYSVILSPVYLSSFPLSLEWTN